MNVPSFFFLGEFTGQNYRQPESTVSLPQAIMAGIAIACFALGVLAFAVALS